MTCTLHYTTPLETKCNKSWLYPGNNLVRIMMMRYLPHYDLLVHQFPVET